MLRHHSCYQLMGVGPVIGCDGVCPVVGCSGGVSRGRVWWVCPVVGWWVCPMVGCDGVGVRPVVGCGGDGSRGRMQPDGKAFWPLTASLRAHSQGGRDISGASLSLPGQCAEHMAHSHWISTQDSWGAVCQEVSRNAGASFCLWLQFLSE